MVMQGLNPSAKFKNAAVGEQEYNMPAPSGAAASSRAFGKRRISTSPGLLSSGGSGVVVENSRAINQNYERLANVEVRRPRAIQNGTEIERLHRLGSIVLPAT